MALAFVSLFYGITFLALQVRIIILFWIAVLGIILVILFFIPIGKVLDADVKPARRYDERDIMFARARLQPGTAEYNTYYQRMPDKQASDDQSRSEAGLLSEGSYFYNRRLFAASKGGFFLTDALREFVDGPITSPPVQMQEKDAAGYIKALTRYFGCAKQSLAFLPG